MQFGELREGICDRSHLSVNKISSYSSNQGGSYEEHISLITIMFCFNEFGSVFSDCVVFYGDLHVLKNLLFTLSKFDLVHAAKERKNHEKN